MEGVQQKRKLIFALPICPFANEPGVIFMVRVRMYSLTLSLPILLVAAGVIYNFVTEPAPFFALTFGSVCCGAGLFMLIVFWLILACPRCGKSPYAIGPSVGPFALAGKPWPDAKCSRCGFDFLAKTTECNTSSEIPPPK